MKGVLEFWLLNLAVHFPVPLNLLPRVLDGDDRNATALNVRSLRGINFLQGVEYLIELSERGLVGFRLGYDELLPSTVLSLLNNPDADRQISFQLTEKGGLAWEHVAEPRWHEMSDGSALQGSSERQWNWTWYSQDRERLMAVLGWYPFIQDEQIDLRTIEWAIHDDYAVRYWKRLSKVHVVTFTSYSSTVSTPAWPGYREPRWFSDWKDPSRWYREPWDDSGWPPELS